MGLKPQSFIKFSRVFIRGRNFKTQRDGIGKFNFGEIFNKTAGDAFAAEFFFYIKFVDEAYVSAELIAPEINENRIAGDFASAFNNHYSAELGMPAKPFESLFNLRQNYRPVARIFTVKGLNEFGSRIAIGIFKFSILYVHNRYS